jgi:hypothetical protein
MCFASVARPICKGSYRGTVVPLEDKPCNTLFAIPEWFCDLLPVKRKRVLPTSTRFEESPAPLLTSLATWTLR